MVVAGCSATGAPAQSASPKSAPATSVENIRRAWWVCDGTGITNTAAYTTPAAAKIALFEGTPSGNTTQWSMFHVGNDPWDVQDFDDVGKANSVLCAKATDAPPTKMTCKFNSGSATILQYTWQLTLRESRTAKVLTDLGTVPSMTSCPTVAVVTNGEAPGTPDRTKTRTLITAFMKG